MNVWNGQKIIDIISTDDGITSNAIVSSYRSSDGSLYFGTDGGGAFRVKNGKVDSLFLKGNTIWSFHEDKMGNFYFGTNDRGMIYFRNGKWDTLSINNGLSHNSILGILEDEQGKLYLTADNGLNIVEFSESTFNIRKMGKSDGLASNECNQGAYYKDSQGYLWFGTVKGVSRFDPNLCIPNTNPPILHLNRFQLYDRNLPVNKLERQWNFSYDENYFKFAFIGIDLCSPDKVRYKYRLSGIDQNWIETDDRSVQYTNLDDKDYTFKLMAGNEWGYWSEPIQLSITIAPPFWERWWFILLSFLIVISPVVVVVRLRIQRMLALERLRTKIAADLIDRLNIPFKGFI
ncbi:MAG: two-component regulator propeller domain-containing protein [Calditrichaceae bacterium]